jgi:peptidoglycan/xylan/chitin deacetylase (PgdA/CDA1 family)
MAQCAPRWIASNVRRVVSDEARPSGGAPGVRLHDTNASSLAHFHYRSMTSTRNTQAGAEPRSTQTWFGIPVREARLRTRLMLLRLLGASPLPALAKRMQPPGDLIICLHNVVANHGPLGVNRGLDLTAAELEAVLAHLRVEGYRPVSLEDIRTGSKPDLRHGERRVAITFDDGYAGNFHVAYPLLHRHGVPFTVYVTTGFMDREVRVWWYALERLLARVDGVAFEHAGRTFTYSTLARTQKVRAYRAIRALLLTARPALADELLEQLFGWRGGELRGLADVDLLTPEHVRALSRDPLVTIGAHTVSHPVLRALSGDESRREIRGCRERLEAVTGGPILHFAYPFGNRAAFGAREETFVRESGYVTATTTCARQIDEIDRPTALPRIMLSAEMDAVTSLNVLQTGWFAYRDRVSPT